MPCFLLKSVKISIECELSEETQANIIFLNAQNEKSVENMEENTIRNFFF